MFSCYTRDNSIKSVNFKVKQEVDRMTSCGDMAIWNFSKVAVAAILDLLEPEIAPLDLPAPKTPPWNQTWSGLDDRLPRYGHLKFFEDGGGRHLGFVRTVNSAIWSAVIPENPTLEPNIKWIGCTVACMHAACCSKCGHLHWKASVYF